MNSELIRAFAGASTSLQYMNLQVALGETSEIDLAAFATLASTMLRIGRALGFARRQRDVTPNLKEYLAKADAPDETDEDDSAND